MSRSITIILALTLCLSALEVSGQELNTSWLEFEAGRQSMNSFGMGVLIIWAAVNILTGVLGWILARGAVRYFFQMNAFWNGVNLWIGLAGYMGVATDLSAMTLGQSIEAYHDMQNLYILNVGLDVTYIAIAFLLFERAKSLLKWHPLLKGYGYSLIIQGSFLFVFDLIMFFVHKSHAVQYLYPLLV